VACLLCQQVKRRNIIKVNVRIDNFHGGIPPKWVVCCLATTATVYTIFYHL
jgi:hypothetical protein